MIVIENFSNDPAYNLALEEFLLLHRRPIRDVFFLWQNEPTVVIGRHQNTFDEINREYVKANNVHVVRRNSGGGAVYHDLGNLNFSFLVDERGGNHENGFRFDRFTQPVIHTLKQLGVHAENSGRNDIAIAGRKISGNAQYRSGGRLLHHGTILFDSNLENLSMALNYAPEKYVSRAVASIRSRVSNVCEHLTKRIDMAEFRRLLSENAIAEYGLECDSLNEMERQAVMRLRDEKYHNWDWNYGRSPAFWTHTGLQKFPWGTLDVRLEVQNGKVVSCAFYGDYFSPGDPQVLAEQLIGLPFDRAVFENSLTENDIRDVFPELPKISLLNMLF